MATFCKEMAIFQPAHQFVFIGKDRYLPQPPPNLLIHPLKNTSISLWNKWQLKRLLKQTKADRLVSCQKTGFSIQHVPINENNFQQVYFTGSVPEGKENIEVSTATQINPAFKSVVESQTWAEAESVRTSYSGGNSFFLFIGNISETHQLLELLKAFSLFKKWQQSSMQLLIAGSRTNWTSELEEKLATYKYRQDVIIHGKLKEEDLGRLVAASYALLYPVFGNAFPFAMIWAVQAGKAIIATDCNVNRQITDKALWVEPQNTTEGFAKAMILLYKDENQQQSLAQQIKERSIDFNHQQMLASAWHCIEQ
ncbi:MAG: glycosyltransferase [Chitinophagaceae bacterium]